MSIKRPPGINLNLAPTTFSSDISENQTITRKQTVAVYFSFKQSAMETPIKVVEKGGYCF